MSEVSTGSDLSPVKAASESSPSAKPQVSQPPSLPSVSQPRSVTAGDNSKPSRLTVEELDRLFGENAHLLNEGKTSRDVGEKLFHEVRAVNTEQALDNVGQNGTYTIGTWTNYVNDWRYGEGKFTAATRSNLRPQSSATPTPTQKPLVRKRVASGSPMLDNPPSKKRTLNRPSPYTEEEERAMAAHIVDRLPDATRFSPRDWEAFQAKVCHVSLLKSGTLTASTRNDQLRPTVSDIGDSGLVSTSMRDSTRTHKGLGRNWTTSWTTVLPDRSPGKRARWMS